MSQAASLDATWLSVPAPAAHEIASRVATLEETAHDLQRRRSDLIRLFSCIDLTTLTDRDTDESLHELCLEAARTLGTSRPVTVAAVCVWPKFVATAVGFLEDSGIPVAAGIIGTPHDPGTLDDRLRLIDQALRAGAREIDVVVSRTFAIDGAWEELFHEVGSLRAAVGDRTLKTIIGTGALSTTQAFRASQVCLQAGADFIKTSTGKDPVNATLAAGVAMTSALKWFHHVTARARGIKPAGGIGTPEKALQWLDLVAGELGPEGITPARFRVGASGLLSSLRTAVG